MVQHPISSQEAVADPVARAWARRMAGISLAQTADAGSFAALADMDAAEAEMAEQMATTLPGVIGQLLTALALMLEGTYPRSIHDAASTGNVTMLAEMYLDLPERLVLAAAKGLRAISTDPAVPPPPELLRGHRAIAARLGSTTGMVRHLDQVRRIPTVRIKGCPCATPGALAEYMALVDAGIVKAP